MLTCFRSKIAFITYINQDGTGVKVRNGIDPVDELVC